jgi:hypothetical protein
MATGQSAQRGLGGVFGVAELVSWAESGAGRNQLQGGAGAAAARAAVRDR